MTTRPKSDAASGGHDHAGRARELLDRLEIVPKGSPASEFGGERPIWSCTLDEQATFWLLVEFLIHATAVINMAEGAPITTVMLHDVSSKKRVHIGLQICLAEGDGNLSCNGLGTLVVTRTSRRRFQTMTTIQPDPFQFFLSNIDRCATTGIMCGWRAEATRYEQD